MKKQAKPELFNILKTLVDRKVPSLQNQQKLGADALLKINDLKANVQYLEAYNENNRYDREERIETEALIEENEKEIERLCDVIAVARKAKSELKSAAKFYKLYDGIQKNARLKELRKEYHNLDLRSDDLYDLMFSCEINADANVRSQELCEQSMNDLEYYKEEYKEVMGRMDVIMKEIALLQR